MIPSNQRRIDELCEGYLHASEKFIRAREDYRLQFAVATSQSQAKTEVLRKAEADQKTSQLRIDRDLAEVEAALAWQRLLIARGPMTDSVQPLQKFGDL